MAGITLAQAQTQLDAYLAAEAACLSGQRYHIRDRMLQRAPLIEIQAGVALWNSRVMMLTNRAQGVRRRRTVVVGG